MVCSSLCLTGWNGFTDHAVAFAQQPTATQILPEVIPLAGTEARQNVLLVRGSDEVSLGEVHPQQIQWTIADSNVAVIENGIVRPIANGTTTLTATVGKQKRTASIVVTDCETRAQWSFRNHVQSVLTRNGCNSGPCHGAAAGKKGFKLSLRGYDPDYDFSSLTRQASGRRINPLHPEQSLLLTKPAMVVPHKGGLKLPADSEDFRVLAEWVAQGLVPPEPTDAKIERLEMLPSSAQLKPGESHRFVVLAHFSDGHQEDVTRWVKFSSANESVVKVDQQGRVTIVDSGEGAITAWYLAKTEIANVSVPYQQTVPNDHYQELEASSNLIDQHVVAKLRALNLPPSSRCSDAEFLRRASLDANGILPTVEKAEAFLANSTDGQREALIEELLESPEYVDYWTHRWSDLMLVTGARLRPEAVKAYSKWIRTQVEQNRPWDEFVTEILTAKGNALENGAANFYALHQNPLLMSEVASVSFLGMSINCARCHDHPLEKWTNDDYFGMASLFAQVQAKGWGGDFRRGDGKRIVFLTQGAEVIQPRTGKPQPPKPLDAPELDAQSPGDRRIELAKWMTDPANPYFTRAIVNRVWASYFGVGIVEAVDDLRLTNPPSNPELMEALCQFLVENHYDLKALMRLIMSSETYQRSSLASAENEADTRFYSHYMPRRMKAEVLLDAISQVTQVPTEFNQRQQSGTRLEKVDIPLGTRAVQLEDTSIVSYFLDAFGRPERLNTCECERSDEPSMGQVLHLINGDSVNQKLAHAKSVVELELKAELTDDKRVERAFLGSLSRYPEDSEKQAFLEMLSSAEKEERRIVMEDIYWSLLTSKEFLFNH